MHVNEEQELTPGIRQFTTIIRRHTDEIEQDMLESRMQKAGFNPAQPRAPAGNPDGGQWVQAGGGGGSAKPQQVRIPGHKPMRDHPDSDYPDAITPVYPVEELIASVFGLRSFRIAAVAVGRLRKPAPWLK